MPHDFIFLLLKPTTYKITVRSMARAAFHRFTPLLTLEGHSWVCVSFLANHSSIISACNLKDVSLSFF